MNRDREHWASFELESCDPDVLARARVAGYDTDPTEERFVYRDSRRMTTIELEAMGHARLPPMAVIRASCLDCCAGNSAEVVAASRWPVPWPYRTGHNPWCVVSESQREAGRGLRRKINSGTSDPAESCIRTRERVESAFRAVADTGGPDAGTRVGIGETADTLLMHYGWYHGSCKR
jgi:hypothetical protein